ncbi:hypothetical protein SUNI508_14094 [Seiridium unicorne]|uniref:Uncharacterized protein n=1 Tax=Seiridium unicorne TaxID=138068 RepID=A0ABR2UYU7_9PEZI
MSFSPMSMSARTRERMVVSASR